MKIDIAARRAHERPTCAYCRDEVAPSDALALCPTCGVTFHQPCRAELTRCPTPGCGGFDEAALGARRRADEDAEREARRDAARARREAEDRAAADARGRAAPEPRVVEETTTRVGRRQARTAGALGRWAAVGATVVGLFGGMVGYVLTLDAPPSSPGPLTWLLASAALGAVEATLIGLLGVREEPVVRWGKDDDASCLVIGFVSAGMVAAGLVGWALRLPVEACGLAGIVLSLPLALRWFGLR